LKITVQQQDAKPEKVSQYEKSQKHKPMILQLLNISKFKTKL
jgi:hypothetical protein